MSQSYTLKGRDICVLSGPRTDAAVQSLADPANDLLHARLPCPAPGHWAVQLQECHEDHPHLPHGGVGPHQLDPVWFTGLRGIFRPQLPSPLTHRLIHPVRRKKASKRNRQSTARDVYVVGGYREEGWDPVNPGLSMPFVPLAALLFLFGDVFEGYQQQDDPASVPLLSPLAGGGINPSPLWVVHGRPAFSRACAAVHGCSEWAMVLLLPASPVPDPDEYSVPEVVWMSNVRHDPHVAGTSLRDGGAVEQGSVVVYQPPCSPTVWGAEYTTALDAIKSVCGCDLAWRTHAVYRPKVVLSPELTASSAASLGKVVQSPNSDVAWLEPHRYCLVPVATKVTWSDASPQGDNATNVDGCHLRHGPGGGDHRPGGIPVAHAPVSMHGARGGCVRHRSASPQGAGGPVPLHQGADITSGQPAHTELDSGGAAAAATPSRGAAPPGGEAELALRGGPA